MKNFDWKKLLPHILAIGIFLIVAVIYCKPALEGKVLNQSDVTQWKAMSKDAFNYRERHGHFPLWINNMFSGMPSFQLGAEYNNKLPYIFINIFSLWLPKPINFFFLACVCFYFLAQALRINRVISILGSLAFAYATYNPVIMVAGHDTKMLSIALMPAFIGSLILLYNKNYAVGTALTAITASTLFAANHPQIAYYTGLIAIAMTIGYVVNWIKEKQFKHLMLAGSLAAFAAITGLLINASILFTTYDFAKATIRGGNALSKDIGDKESGGLSTEYALSYSLYKTEPLVLLFPKLYGGSSGKDERGENSKVVEALSAMPQELQSQLQNNISYYWGGIEGVGTAGPPYIGSIICFFALMGMFLLDNKHKWWIAAITVISILMSWGSYFLAFNEPLLKYLPFYNKFRAPSMIMVIPQLVLTMLACLTLNDLIKNNTTGKQILFDKKFKNGLIAFGVLVGLTLILYMTSDFYNAQDKNIIKQIKDVQPQIKEPVMSFFTALKEDRQALMINSIIRSLIFIGIATGLIYLYKKGTIKQQLLTILLTLAVFIDVITIDTKYFNSDNFQDAEEYEATFNPTPVDQQLLQDKSFYRIFNTTTSPFSDAMTSYYHYSVGGYNPAKLSLYQDLIENQLAKSPLNMPVLNMLNTKYFITGNPASPQVQLNPEALGQAWFVKTVKIVDGPAAEMKALDNINPKDTAVAQKQFENIIKYDANPADSSASIQLVNNDNDIVKYKSANKNNGFGVFSEVYYDRGWKAYIDGKETAIAKVNYVLRGLSIPAGNHAIEFRFEPQAYKIGSTFTSVFQVVLLLLIVVAVFVTLRKKTVIKA